MRKNEAHPTLIYAEDIKAICKPLQLLEISTFSHVRIDGEGKFAAISNNPAFHEHYIQNQYYNADIHMANQIEMGKYVLWDAIACDGKTDKLNKEAEDFGVKHSFTIIEKNGKNKDYYHFSTHTDDSINQVYLGNLDILKLFVLSFQEKINQSKMLSHAYNIQYSIERNLSDFSINPVVNNRKQFLESLRFSLPDFSSEITPRELEIFSWFHHGKTQGQIADILGLKEITIKKHLENLKKKTGCHTQFQLGEYFFSYLS